MLITPAYAQDASSFVSTYSQFLPIVLVFAVFYFMVIRPQTNKTKQLKATLGALKRGDRVVTGGGIVGVVQRVKDGSSEIEVEIAPNVKVTVVRETITGVVAPTAANDTKPTKAAKEAAES